MEISDNPFTKVQMRSLLKNGGEFRALPLFIVLIGGCGLAFCQVDSSSTVVTIAGGLSGFSGDGGPAAAATFSFNRFQTVRGIVSDQAGNIWVADTNNNRIRRISPDGSIRTVAGSGGAGFFGDGGSAVAASLSQPGSIAVDQQGRLNIADSYNGRVRRVNSNGSIQTIAGGGTIPASRLLFYAFGTEGVPATELALDVVRDLALDPQGFLYVNNSAQGGDTNFRVKLNGLAEPACCATLFDPLGNVYRPSGDRIFRNSTVIAGTGASGFFGDGGSALAAQFDGAGQLALDKQGNLYIADTNNRRIRKVSSTGVITTVVGSGQPASGVSSRDGDGGPAGQARLGLVNGLAFDDAGHLYFSEMVGDVNFDPISVSVAAVNRIRKVLAAPQPPSISTGGVVNAADYTSVVAPGMIVALFGDSMASKVSSATGTPLPTALDGTSVEVNGQAIPLFFVSPKQINAQMPFGISGQLQVRVRTATGISAPATITVVASAPRLFTKSMDGKGEPILLHSSDWSPGSAASPARPGEYLILFLTGLGAVSPAIPAGQAAGDNGTYGPLNQLAPNAVTVSVGGKQAAILFAGLAPGFVGLYQINLQAPVDMPRGRIPVVVSTKDGPSQAGVLAAADVSVGPPTDLSGVKMEFVFIPAGEFMMGCSPGDRNCQSDENPMHRVEITKSFELGKFEVTQAQWQAVMGSNPSYSKSSDRPVERVSWNDIQTFLAKLTARNDGYHYRLPTEAEWEYAARAESTGPYYGKLADVAWCNDNSGSQTHPVGQKAPNSWGLYDMLGNVWESCQDWYDGSYYSKSPVADPPGASSGSRKVLRGVSWYYEFSWLWRVSVRGYVEPGYGNFDIGFRCLRER